MFHIQYKYGQQALLLELSKLLLKTKHPGILNVKYYNIKILQDLPIYNTK